MEYIAHKTEDGREQTLKEHLENTALLCRENAIPDFKEIAYLCGLIHDIGKGQHSWQRYIRGEGRGIPHALCGALEVHKQHMTTYSPMLEYVIASHHAGLYDGGLSVDEDDEKRLNAVLKRTTESYDGILKKINPIYPPDTLLKYFSSLDKYSGMELYAFFTRYLFSCLTDADFIDTERFCTPDVSRGIEGNFEEAYKRICSKLDSFKAETKLQKARGEIQRQVYDAVSEDANIFSINMPTGSGKTLCSMRAALKKAIEQKKKRIIYVIPFVSVIEQTANVFKDIFSDSLPVLEHHSNYDFDKADDNNTENELTGDKLKRTCENWDAPLIVTTNIQFFESVYHCKSSRLRKMHNMADSVIVFDEVHMLPVDYIQPCVRAISYITKYLNSTAIIMSATMPDFAKYIEKFTGNRSIKNAVSDTSDYEVFKKCRYTYIGVMELEALSSKLLTEDSALAIVNTKKSARELYRFCTAFDGEVFHLSTNLTGADRAEKIRLIGERLKSGKRTLAISTSLIEAGVDLDFQTVYRENAGLDNILQSGGRCNREGLRETGDVYVFETDGGIGDLKIKAGITRKLFEEFEDISDEKCVSEYYSRFMTDCSGRINRNSITQMMGEKPRIYSIPFRSYAEKFEMIDENTIGVVIPCEENEKLIASLEYTLSVKRRLQKYCVSVRHYELEEMIKLGIVCEISGVYILSNPDYYNKEIGLDINAGQDYIL